jgi:phosphatidylglycerophosphate synthase
VSGAVLTLPNLVTIGRAVAAIPIAMAILAGRFQIALALVVIAGLSDTIDGTLARKTGTTSDPLAD